VNIWKRCGMTKQCEKNELQQTIIM
jgi:hypothetical protein